MSPSQSHKQQQKDFIILLMPLNQLQQAQPLLQQVQVEQELEEQALEHQELLVEQQLLVEQVHLVELELLVVQEHLVELEQELLMEQAEPQQGQQQDLASKANTWMLIRSVRVQVALMLQIVNSVIKIINVQVVQPIIYYNMIGHAFLSMVAQNPSRKIIVYSVQQTKRNVMRDTVMPFQLLTMERAKLITNNVLPR